MRDRLARLLLRDPAPSVLWGVLVLCASVTAITLAIFPLRAVAPAVSAGVLYLLAVLVVSTGWGVVLGVLTGVASAAAFNFFHIEPTGRFTIADGENWVALVVFLAAAVVVSTLADVARERAAEADRRRREADLAADLARILLAEDLRDALPRVASRLADALGLPPTTLTLDPTPQVPLGGLALPLRDGDRDLGTLVLAGTPDPECEARLRGRVLVAVEALLLAAVERDRLQAEVVETRALRRSDTVKTAILRAVSHDLRTPLTAILAAGEALASSSLEDEDRTALAGTVSAETERLARLVDKLLDLSRLEAGAATPRPDWCALDEVIDAAIREQADPSRFHAGVGADLPLLRVDAAQVERAVANLLENAARHSAPHPVQIRARVVSGRVVLRVVDRGAGISARDRRRIFEPFQRGEGEPAETSAGSGLGLAIVKGFVEVNGGTVHVESLPGQGTSFVVEFPASLTAAAAAEGVGT